MRQHIVCGSRRKQGWVTATTLCNKAIYTSFMAKPCLSYLGSGCTFLILGKSCNQMSHTKREKKIRFLELEKVKWDKKYYPFLNSKSKVIKSLVFFFFVMYDCMISPF